MLAFKIKNKKNIVVQKQWHSGSCSSDYIKCYTWVTCILTMALIKLWFENQDEPLYRHYRRQWIWIKYSPICIPIWNKPVFRTDFLRQNVYNCVISKSWKLAKGLVITCLYFWKEKNVITWLTLDTSDSFLKLNL